MASSSLRVAIVGAGWAGCAAAVELCRQGHHVTLFEASRTLGGRARRVDVEGRILDNGQHILLGAYAATLRMMRLIGVESDNAFLRLPLQMRYPQNCDGMDFIAPRLPAPFHLLAALLKAKGLAVEDKLSLARFSTTARWMEWRLDVDCSVSELLERFDQTDRIIQLMWRPLCIAALNTPPERASAQIFLNVLQDSLGARRAASDMLIPREDLSELFPQKAATFIARHGGTVHTGVNVKCIEEESGRWNIRSSATTPSLENNPTFDSVVIATHPSQASALLAGHTDTTALEALQYEPISTCYLQYDSDFKLPLPFFALKDNATTNEWGQFVFDKGYFAQQRGLLAVVVSASSDAISMGHQELTEAIAAQLGNTFRMLRLGHPLWTKIISEKRATFSCTPSLLRPDNGTGVKGLALAGDYTQGRYPATLESAVQSGVQAARYIMEENFGE